MPKKQKHKYKFIYQEDKVNKLIKKAAQGDSKALDKLEKNFGSIVYNVTTEILGKNKYLTQEYNDLIEDKKLTLWKFTCSFNPEKGSKFSTWVYNNTRWMCLSLLTEGLRKKVREICLETAQDVIDLSSKDEESKGSYSAPQELDLQDKDDLRIIYRIIKNSKEDAALNVFKLRVMSDKQKTWREIGSIQGCNPQHAVNLFNKKLKEIISELNSITKDTEACQYINIKTRNQGRS